MIDADLIADVYAIHGSIRGTARELGVDERTLRRWAQDDPRIAAAFGKHPVGDPADKQFVNARESELQAVVDSLRKENRDLRARVNGETPANGMKVLFFDTESTDLSASWGRILCTSYAVNDGPVVTLLGGAGKNAIDDSQLILETREALESADIIVGWNSILHDIPLINARLARIGERPVKTGEKHGTWHLDLMYYSTGASMKIGGKALDKVAKYFACENQKTPLSGETWQLAAAGDKAALGYIVGHCEADVEVLREVARHLFPYVKKFQFSLSEVYPFVAQIPSRR